MLRKMFEVNKFDIGVMCCQVEALLFMSRLTTTRYSCPCGESSWRREQYGTCHEGLNFYFFLAHKRLTVCPTLQLWFFFFFIQLLCEQCDAPVSTSHWRHFSVLWFLVGSPLALAISLSIVAKDATVWSCFGLPPKMTEAGFVLRRLWCPFIASS